MKILAFLSVLFLPSAAFSQIACFNYGTTLSCDGPSSMTNIAPLGPTGGVITEYGSGKNTLEPYTIITLQPRSRRPYSLDLEPLDPLPSLLDEPLMPGLELPGLELSGMDLP